MIAVDGVFFFYSKMLNTLDDGEKRQIGWVAEYGVAMDMGTFLDKMSITSNWFGAQRAEYRHHSRLNDSHSLNNNNNDNNNNSKRMN